MSIEFVCECAHKLRVRDIFAGRHIRCPECREIILVPSASQPARSRQHDAVSQPNEQPNHDSSEQRRQESSSTKTRRSKKKSAKIDRRIIAAGLAGLLLVAVGISAIKPVFSSRENSQSPNPSAGLESRMVNGVRLVVHEACQGKVKFLAPEQFFEMDEEAKALKYPHGKRPQFVLSNADHSVNLAANLTKSRASADEVIVFARDMERMMRRVFNTKWHQTTERTINGHNWILFDFQSQAVDTDIRNYMALTTLENRILIVSFNLAIEEEQKWWPIGEAFINSLRITD